jgi:uncharacterized membrane protein
MNPIDHRSNRAIHVLLMLVGIAGAFPAHADYKYTVIEYPGAVATQLWGINDDGIVVGDAYPDPNGPAIGFVYDSRRNTITTLPNYTGAESTAAIGINNSGAVVGSAGNLAGTIGSGFILRKGAFTLFDFPGSVHTEARSIGASGLITGDSLDGAGNQIGFIYDRARNRYTTFLPSIFTIAQGINGRGDVVGSVHLLADGAYVGSPEDHYGFVRHRNGVIQLFQVSGGIKTRARGISESGLIVGYYTDSGGAQHGFVARSARGPDFQLLTIAPGNQLDVPGASATYPEGINERGWISGMWIDANGVWHGFIAVPLQGHKDH